MKRYLLIALAASILIGLFFLTEHYQYVEHKSSPNRPWQAATLLLAQDNISSRQIYGSASLFPLPSTDTLLIMDKHRSQLSESQIDQLHDWVRQGGRLIIAARTLYYHEENQDDRQENETNEACEAEEAESNTLEDIDEDEPENPSPNDGRINYANTDYDEETLADNDPLVYSFGISAWEVPLAGVDYPLEAFRSSNSFQQSADSEDVQACLLLDYDDQGDCLVDLCGDDTLNIPYSTATLSGTLRRLALPADDKLMHIDQYDDVEDDEYYPSIPYTETTIEAEIFNQYGSQVMRVSYGDGDVVAMTNFDIWRDDQLSYLDHAWLLHTLADDATQAWWIHNIDMPPLLYWLWQRAWPMLISLTIVLLVFLWLYMPRRGPILLAETQRARDFLDHLHAGGVFLQRTGQSQTLLGPLRAQVMRKLSTHPAGNNEPKCFDVAAALSGIPSKDVKAALKDIPDNEQQLTAFIDTLQILRNRL